MAILVKIRLEDPRSCTTMSNCSNAEQYAQAMCTASKKS